MTGDLKDKFAGIYCAGCRSYGCNHVGAEVNRRIAKRKEREEAVISLNNPRYCDYCNSHDCEHVQDAMAARTASLAKDFGKPDGVAAMAGTGDATRDVLNERGKTYGAFEDNARISQDLKAIMRAAPAWKDFQPFQREALELMATKMSRMLTNSPKYRDGPIDLAGYAMLILECIDREANSATPEMG